MTDSIDDVKNRLRERFLGKCGIHALGIGRAAQAIKVYVGPEAASGRPELLERLRKDALPFPVVVVEEESPRMA